MSLAIFDLDNTLIGGDSDHSWGVFLCEKGLVDEKVYTEANDQFYVEYQNGTLDIFKYLEFALQPLTEHSAEALEALHNEFMAEKIAPMLLPKADALIEKHRAQGDTLLIITATNSFITKPIAQKLGIENMLATEPEFVDGRYTGKVAGIPCFQDGKVKRLEAWLETNVHALEGSFFYSDSINDAPLFEVVENPVAVDPCPKLSEYAQQKGMPIISLR